MAAGGRTSQTMGMCSLLMFVRLPLIAPEAVLQPPATTCVARSAQVLSVNCSIRLRPSVRARLSVNYDLCATLSGSGAF